MQRATMVAALGALVMLAGCAAPPPEVPVVTYTCTGGLQFQARFVRDEAQVTLPGGGELRLPQQPSGSGFWYSNGRYELRGKGREAQWTVGRAMPLGCLVVGG